jgi:uncharacterized protein (UPF0335 family)
MARRRKADEPKIGHNSAALNEAERKYLRKAVEKIESLEAQMQTLSEDRAEIYADAKDRGFEVKAMRAVIKQRGEDQGEREAFEAIVEAYKLALGMLADTPLGEAAIKAMRERDAEIEEEATA